MNSAAIVTEPTVNTQRQNVEFYHYVRELKQGMDGRKIDKK